MDESALALGHSFAPRALVNGAIGPNLLASAVLEVVFKLPHVDDVGF